MGRLAEKVSLITGAARGQGAAEARLFAAEGSAVVLTDVLDEPGEALAAALRSHGSAFGSRLPERHRDRHSQTACGKVLFHLPA